MRSFAILLIIFIATIANAQSAEPAGLIAEPAVFIAELKDMLKDKSGACADIAFGETAEMVRKADIAYASGATQDVDMLMDNVYETYYNNEVHYLSLKGESERLRNILAEVKAKMLQSDNLDDTTVIKGLVRSADIKLNMCDIEGAHSVIADLRSRLKL